MLPLTVTLLVPYVENEQQFLLQAVEADVREISELKCESWQRYQECIFNNNHCR